MAKNKKRTVDPHNPVTFTVTTTRAVADFLESFHASGLWGSTFDETVSRLLTDAIENRLSRR